MKEINIKDFLVKKRLEKGITRDKLAFDIGVPVANTTPR